MAYLKVVKRLYPKSNHHKIKTTTKMPHFWGSYLYELMDGDKLTAVTISRYMKVKSLRCKP